MEKVSQAFAVLQNPQAQTDQIREANQWLEHFQSTTEAWTTADQLLSLPADQVGNGSAHVFAAQTMRAKIQYDWAELPPESHAGLRDSLLAHVVRFGGGPQPVLTQLCLAVATLALHMEAWPSAVPDLVGRFTAPAADAVAKLPCLLELLTVLPEEAENFKVGVFPRRRDEFRAGLRSFGPQVLTLLGQVHDQCQASRPLMQATLRCMASWLKGCLVPADALMASPLLVFAFGALSDEQLFDESVDMLVELVHYTHQVEAHAQLVAGIVPHVLQLVPTYDAAVQSGDEDAARALCRLFTETGEQYLQLLITQQPDWAVGLAGAVLRGAAHPEPEIAEITFNFWYMLSEEISGSGRALTDTQRVEARGRFAECFVQLLKALRGLSRMPDDSDGWHADQRDDFRRFRYAVGDVLTDACKVLSSVNCIQEAYEALTAQLPAFSANPQAQWRNIEACVFCARQMITSNEPAFFTAEVVYKLMQLLPTLPPVGELSNTAIRTVGTYANWLSRHPEMLSPMLTFVTHGLSVDKSAAASSQAMKHLCDACAEHLAEEGTMAQLLQMYHGTLALTLHTADRCDLIAALSFVVSQMPLPQVLAAMQAIAQPLVVRLQAALEGTSATGGGGAEVSALLEQICALLGKVAPGAAPSADEIARDPNLQDARHPAVQLLEQLWGVLDSVFARHGADSKVMEKLCRCYKHTSRNTSQGPFRGDFKYLVPRLLPQVTGWFETQPHSCFLYVHNVCIKVYSDSPELQRVFAEAFHRMSLASFRLLSVTPTAVGDNPDVVDDYFELCSSVLACQPGMLLETELILTAFQCGCVGLHTQHREAHRAVVGFFENLIHIRHAGVRGPVIAATFSALEALLLTHGPQLFTALLLAIAGVVPQSRVRFLSPVLKGLVTIDVNTTRVWAEAAVQALPPDGHMDGAVLLQAVFSPEALVRDDRGVSDKTFDHAVEAFSSACRRRRLL